jgi:hypothetical protein
MAQIAPPHSVTVQGSYEPFELQVARGQIMGHSSFTIFGYNPDLDQTEESVWPDGGTVPHPTTANVLSVASTNQNDTVSGAGAQSVFIEGLDGNYNVISETVTMSGTSPVSTTKSYLYINQFYVTSVGSHGSNYGELTIKLGSTLYDIIAIGYNTRTTAHYCVPAGYTAYLVEGNITAGQSAGSTSVTGFLKQHGPDGILRVAAVSTFNYCSVNYDFK